MAGQNPHRTSRRVSRAMTWTATGTFATAAAAAARRWMATWGSDQLERHQRLPGDDLVPAPAASVTRAIFLDITSPPGWLGLYATWLLLLRPVGESRCRLVERSSWQVRPRGLGLPFSLVFEPVDFVMMRRHLLNVQARAHHPHARSTRPVLASTAGTRAAVG